MDSTGNNFLVAVDDGQAEEAKDNTRVMQDAEEKTDADDVEPKSLIMEIYPWIPNFKRMCRSSLVQRSMASLKHLMMYYARNVRPCVNECHTKPLRADKLKDSISETLLFFLYYYREIGEDQDRTVYMDLMSDLLAMYIDMELKASKKGNEHHSKISSRLSTCLHVYLEHSAEHLLDTLLKVHFMTRNYQDILDPVIAKMFKEIDDHPDCNIMYIRYFLVYRLWKKLTNDFAIRNRINLIAIASLGTVPTDFPPFIVESVLPKVPKTQKLSTKLLMLHKFEVEKSCEQFLNFCKKKYISTAGDIDSSSANTIIHKPLHDITDTNRKRPSVSKKVATTSVKVSSLRKFKKSNYTVLIDLTSDSVTEKVIRQKKTRRKLMWLEEAKKRINMKTAGKKDSSVEDIITLNNQLENEDTVDLNSLRIVSPEPLIQQDVLASLAETKSTEDLETSIEDQATTTDTRQVSVILDDKSTLEDALIENNNTLENRTRDSRCDNELEAMANDRKNPVEEMVVDNVQTEAEIVTSSPKVLTTNVKIVTTEKDYSSTEPKSSVNKDENERTLQPTKDAMTIRDTMETVDAKKVESLVASAVPVQLAIKAEHMDGDAYQVVNEEIVSSGNEIPVVAEYASEVSLQTSSSSEQVGEVVVCAPKVQESETQDTFQALVLLANVSQKISSLMTTSATENTATNGELIKVKNYASLANVSTVEEPDTSTDALPFCGSVTTDVINKIVGIYPEDAMDKVAYQVEVSSTVEANPYDESYNEVNGEVPLMSMTNDERITNVIPVDSSTITEKDETNVILNGETIVLFQKSPNSNMYIINKAVESRDHVADEIPSTMRDMTEHGNEIGAFSYDIYENMYCSQPPPYAIPQYNRELSSKESRRNKKIQFDSISEANRVNDPLELVKSGKKKSINFDVTGTGTPGKQKNSTNSSLSRKRHIKQEYNGCANNLSSHIKTNYGIQQCSQEHVETSRSIHIPVTHSTPLSSICTKYTAGAELYLPCHKNCNSIACGLPVNSVTSLHPDNRKTSTGGSSHCSCLNCTYGIVAHCSECILPSGETRSTTIENTSYHLPLHSTVQTSAVQDCSRTGGEDPLVKIYDDQLVCKLEKTILDSKPLDKSVGVNWETKRKYRPKCVDNRLPLKKRFKAIMSVSFEEMSIKSAKDENYPGTPMLSIAALEAEDALRLAEDSNSGNTSAELSPKCRNDESQQSHHAREMIRRDYHKDMMTSPLPSPNGYCQHNGGVESKRKRRSGSNLLSCNIDETRHETNYQKTCKTAIKHKDTNVTVDFVSKRLPTPTKSQQARPSEKVKEEEATPIKKSMRRTRSSKRNVPKVTYCYADGDSDWNPSGGGSKRKRKKTNR